MLHPQEQRTCSEDFDFGIVDGTGRDKFFAKSVTAEAIALPFWDRLSHEGSPPLAFRLPPPSPSHGKNHNQECSVIPNDEWKKYAIVLLD